MLQNPIQYLLDTNILLYWIRRGALQTYLQAVYDLINISPAPLVSIVCEAELRVLALESGWGAAKTREIKRLLSYMSVVPIQQEVILAAYVEIDHFSRRLGRKMGKNDLWIAATAKAGNATILTADKYFDHLPQTMVKHIYIDPASHE